MRSRRRIGAACAILVAMLLAQSPARAQVRPDTAGRPDTGLPVTVAVGGTHISQDGADGLFIHRRPVVRLGQNYTLRAADTVVGVRSVLGDVVLEGHVEDDVVVVLGAVHVKSTARIEGSLAVLGGDAIIESGATIGEDLVVVGGPLTAPPDFAPRGAYVVAGSETLGGALRAVVPWLLRGLLWGRLIVPGLPWVWWVVAIVLLVYLLVSVIFSRSVGAAAAATLERPLSVFLLGLLVLVLTIPMIVVLAATVVGVAALPFVLCAMLLAGLVGTAGVTCALGRALVPQSVPDSRLQSLRSFAIGAVVICLAYMVPVLGVMTWALTTMLGVGAALVAIRQALRRENPPRPPRPAVPEPAASAGESPEEPVPVEGLTDGPTPEPDAPRAVGLGSCPRATFLDRVAAFALDLVLVAIVGLVLNLRGAGWFPLLVLVYHVAFWAWKGTTLGGIVVGLRLIRTTGRDLRFIDALVRCLASLFSLLALGLGCFWMLQDPERQMWHDKIAGTIVVKVPRAHAIP